VISCGWDEKLYAVNLPSLAQNEPATFAKIRKGPFGGQTYVSQQLFDLSLIRGTYIHILRILYGHNQGLNVTISVKYEPIRSGSEGAAPAVRVAHQAF
jgi:hypothetical protein